MGRIGQVITTERDADGALNVRVDPGGAASGTAEHFAPAGLDSVPLPGDFVSLVDSAGAGAQAVAGYHDPVNAGVAENGEFRIYARATDGTLVCDIWLKKDGKISIAAMNGAEIEITSTGPVTLNSPDVRVGDAAGAGLARVGDIVAGTLHALSATAGLPIAPGPPVPGGGVPFVGQIVSGSTKAKG